MASQEINLKIIEKSLIAEDIVKLVLQHPDGGVLPSFNPGSHIDVHINGVIRQYSLINTPDIKDRYILGIKRERAGRGVSNYIHTTLSEGDSINVSVPRDNFYFSKGAEYYYLFAGGIGITPLLCMAEYLRGEGISFELHYSIRNIKHSVLTKLIPNISMLENIYIHEGLDASQSRLNIYRILNDQRISKSKIYCCGPSGFMDTIHDEAIKLGWPAEQIHREHFSAEPTDTTDKNSFDVIIRSTGQTLHINSEQTIAEVLLANGIDIPLSCEQGVCGTCLTEVAAGKPDHRDYFLTDKEKESNEVMTPCCSRSLSKVLTLKL